MDALHPRRQIANPASAKERFFGMIIAKSRIHWQSSLPFTVKREEPFAVECAARSGRVSRPPTAKPLHLRAAKPASSVRAPRVADGELRGRWPRITIRAGQRENRAAPAAILAPAVSFSPDGGGGVGNKKKKSQRSPAKPSSRRQSAPANRPRAPHVFPTKTAGRARSTARLGNNLATGGRPDDPRQVPARPAWGLSGREAVYARTFRSAPGQVTSKVRSTVSRGQIRRSGWREGWAFRAVSCFCARCR